MEGAGETDESILKDLSPLPDDISPMGSAEYEAWCKDTETACEADDQSSPPKQVFATIAGQDEQKVESDQTPSDGIPKPTVSGALPRINPR
jgi:hypothetical protein